MYCFNITDVTEPPGKTIRLLGHRVRAGKHFPLAVSKYKKFRKKLDRLVEGQSVAIGSEIPRWVAVARRKAKIGAPVVVPPPTPAVEDAEEEDSKVEEYLEERAWAWAKAEVVKKIKDHEELYRTGLVKACEILGIDPKGKKEDLAEELRLKTATAEDELDWDELNEILVVKE